MELATEDRHGRTRINTDSGGHGARSQRELAAQGVCLSLFSKTWHDAPRYAPQHADDDDDRAGDACACASGNQSYVEGRRVDRRLLGSVPQWAARRRALDGARRGTMIGVSRTVAGGKTT